MQLITHQIHPPGDRQKNIKTSLAVIFIYMSEVTCCLPDCMLGGRGGDGGGGGGGGGDGGGGGGVSTFVKATQLIS